ncbi:unnamed protein product [Coffea canephora]|uniref:DDE Tnp4 domain-containing protein n=1 Tax=Coffea canephora TaxID=49390 RepID=A0A068TR08_COFCA|nr:unnamed protein product [Coffea canephora]
MTRFHLKPKQIPPISPILPPLSLTPRILKNTLLDPNSGFLMPPLGKYYAVDAAYTNIPGFMAPFRGA